MGMNRQRSNGGSTNHLGQKLTSFQIKTQRDLSQGAPTIYAPKVIANPQIVGKSSTKVNIREVQALLDNLKMSSSGGHHSHHYAHHQTGAPVHGNPIKQVA